MDQKSGWHLKLNQLALHKKLLECILSRPILVYLHSQDTCMGFTSYRWGGSRKEAVLLGPTSKTNVQQCELKVKLFWKQIQEVRVCHISLTTWRQLLPLCTWLTFQRPDIAKAQVQWTWRAADNVTEKHAIQTQIAKDHRYSNHKFPESICLTDWLKYIFTYLFSNQTQKLNLPHIPDAKVFISL